MEDTFGQSAYLPIYEGIATQTVLPDWFWDRIACIIYAKSHLNESFYEVDTKTVFLTRLWGNFPRTPKMWQSSLCHEFGHAYHYNTKLSDDNNIDTTLRNFYRDAKDLMISLTSEQENLLKVEKAYTNAKDMLKKYGALYTLPELLRYLTVVGDIFASLSEGELGFGHPDTYWQDAIRRFHELWANSTDVYFNGNPILEDYFPTYFQLIQKYCNDERNRAI